MFYIVVVGIKGVIDCCWCKWKFVVCSGIDCLLVVDGGIGELYNVVFWVGIFYYGNKKLVCYFDVVVYVKVERYWWNIDYFIGNFL